MPFVAIQKSDGNVFVTDCNCPASRGGQCSHIACTMFMIEELSHGLKPKIDEACTSKKQKWGQGLMRQNDPKAINEVITCHFVLLFAEKCISINFS